MPEDVNDLSPQSPQDAEEVSYPTLEELAALLPQYEMHEIIGVGGMGAVYLGRQAALDRWVAIKVLPVSAAQQADDAQRFIKEARAMARLVHPHIVAVFDFGQTYAGHLYLVMEYVQGSDLHRRTRAGEITAERARRVIAQLCDALQFAHDNGVAHRDIKPANILITDDWQVKVADFGLARDLSAQPNPDEPEYGTPDYTAPERLIIGAIVDHRADIYALGVVIHEMLTGRTPLAAGAEAGKGLPDGFAGIISKCLMQDPDRRYQKASEVKVALLTATAEKKIETQTQPTPITRRAPGPMSSTYKPSPLAGLMRALGPIGWGLASAVLLSLLGWAVLRNKVQQQEAVSGSSAPAPANTTAGAGDLAVFAPKVEPVEPVVIPPVPVPMTEPEPPAVVTMPAKPIEEPVVMLPEISLDQPYLVPEGEPGEVARFKGHTGPVYDVKLLKDQRRVVSVGYDQTLRVWDALSQHELLRVDPTIGNIGRLFVSPDEKQVIAASFDTDQLALLDLDSGKLLAKAQVPNERLIRLSYVPDGSRVIIATHPETGPGLFSWDLKSDSAPTPISGWDAWVYELLPLPDHNSLFLYGTQPTNPGSKSRVAAAAKLSLTDASFEPLKYQSRAVWSRFRLSVDGTHAATLGSALGVVTWPSLEPVQMIPLARDGPRPWSAALVNENQCLIAPYSDKTLRVLEVSTGKELHNMNLPLRPTEITVSRDEKWAVIATSYEGKQPTQATEYDLLLWRLPDWSLMKSDEAVAKQVESEMADLATHDPELAKLRDECKTSLQAPNAKDSAAQLQTLNAQYITAVRRESLRLPPTEQRVLLTEVEKMALGARLPPVDMDEIVPAPLKKLRGIYRSQLAALNQKQEEAQSTYRKAVEAFLNPLKQKREAASDRLGLARLNLVTRSLLDVSNEAGKAMDTSLSAPSVIGTQVKRPDREGTVVVIPRSVAGTNYTTPNVNTLPSNVQKAVAVVGGRDHAITLEASGLIRAWGRWANDDAVAPVQADQVVRISSSDNAALALRENGQVVSWGPGRPASLWTPPPGRVVADICAGDEAGGFILCTDGSLHHSSGRLGETPATSPRSDLGPVARLFYIHNSGYCAVLKDGRTSFWGVDTPPITLSLNTFLDTHYFSFSPRFAVALNRDGTLNGWGDQTSNQSYRVRKFVGCIGLPYDYGGRVFPVHRADHTWEMVPNPAVADFIAEERTGQLEGRLRGCVDAHFAEYTVIAIKP